MKHINALLALIVVAALAAYHFVPVFKDTVNNFAYQSPCDELIAYTVGSIDQRFNLSESQIKSDIDQAARVWSHAYGKELFIYDPTAELKVNMVFDERQGLTNQIGNLETDLKSKQEDFRPEIAAYERSIEDFQKRVSALNEQIKYWNERGGAPKEEYDKLTSEQQALRNQGEGLDAEAKRLNQTANSFNAQVGFLNQKISTFNIALNDKPEEGLYDPNTNQIDIFFHVDEKELVHTLAHELGHARGMGHAPGPTSVMFFKSNRETVASSEDKEELQRVCAKLPVWEIWQKKGATYLQDYLRNRQLQSGK